MADRMLVSAVEGLRRRSAHARARRRIALRDRFASPAADEAGSYEPVRQILRDILESACQVMGAGQAFVLVSRSRTMMDVAATHAIGADHVIDTVLPESARAVQICLRERIMTAGDLDGPVQAMREGAGEERVPAMLCVPLDLGAHGGVICLLGRQQTRRVSDLDLEIVQALAEQAALAISAASHHSALSRLQDSLSSFEPSYA